MDEDSRASGNLDGVDNSNNDDSGHDVDDDNNENDAENDEPKSRKGETKKLPSEMEEKIIDHQKDNNTNRSKRQEERC